MIQNYVNKIQAVRQSEVFFDGKKHRVTAKWQDENHIYKGENPIVLITVPEDLLIIEFEYPDRKQNIRAVLETGLNCDVLGLQYAIYDHNGKSPYLWLRFKSG